MTTMTSTIDLSLDRIGKLVPHFPPYTRPTVHITGTNGKGSVASIVASILRESGMKVGKFNSPHLVRPRDAIEIGGRSVEEERYDEMYTRIERVNTRTSRDRIKTGGKPEEIGASPFEVLTITALQLFEEERIDIAVIEVGMGGRLDATNILPQGVVKVSAMTMVDLDHTRWLGSTVSAIAREKAGIARRGAPFVLGPQSSKWETEVQRVVQESTRTVGTTMRRGARVSLAPSSESSSPACSSISLPPPPTKVLYTPGGKSESPEISLDLSLRGAHQVDNLSTALGIIECLQEQKVGGSPICQITTDAIARGVANTKWPGRLEFIRYTSSQTGRSYMILLDGAHNTSSATALRAYLDSILPSGTQFSFVLALSDSPPKAPTDTLIPLLRLGDHVSVTAFSSVEDMPWVRPVDVQEIHKVAKLLVGEKGEVWEQVKSIGTDSSPLVASGGLEDVLVSAIEHSDSDLVVVAGSLYLVADFYRLMKARPQEFIHL